MTRALTGLAWSAAYVYALWLLYVLIMGFYRAWLAKRLTRTALVLAFPALIVGYIVDLAANWTIAWAVFMEPPRRPLELVTDRLSRYVVQDGDGWKKRCALWVCQTLLDYFDPHNLHCANDAQHYFNQE